MRINRTVFAAQSRSVPNGGAPTFDARDALKRADEARVLVSEITAIAAGAGATGVARTLNAVESLTRLALKNVQTLDVNDPPSPPKLVRQTFEALGATYVKLGQFIASAPSVFPAEYVEEFQKCLDETEPTEFAIIRRTIEKDLGKNIDDVFASIDPVPIASASVAQVHSWNREAAPIVQYPQCYPILVY